LHIDNNKNKLIVVSLGPLSKHGGGMEVIYIKNKKISSLWKAGTTSPFGSLDVIVSDATITHYMLLTILQERYIPLMLMGQDMLL
jgi:hypothetical protein